MVNPAFFMLFWRTCDKSGNISTKGLNPKLKLSSSKKLSTLLGTIFLEFKYEFTDEHREEFIELMDLKIEDKRDTINLLFQSVPCEKVAIEGPCRVVLNNPTYQQLLEASIAIFPSFDGRCQHSDVDI